MRTTSYFLLGLTVISSSRATPSITFLSFDDGNSDQAAFDRAAGSFISGVDEVNPVPNDSVNPSSLVGRYIRNPAIRWDWSSFSTSAINDASLYLNNELAFQMDVLTYDAEIGTQIDITIEDTTITATECFPLGRHSRYTAVTSVQGAWERLTFSKLDQPDAGVANDAINAVLISYAPGEFVSGTFYIDNLVAVSTTTAVTSSPTSHPTTKQPTFFPITLAPISPPPTTNAPTAPPPVSRAATFLSFDDGNSDQAAFDRAAGTFISGADEVNPVTNDSVNPSSLVGRYIRDPAIRWDWSSFSTSAINDASLYLNNELAFQMDVLTYDAEIGTQIDITIEDTTITATECFPLGRHSRYTAVTSVQGAWERLTFSKLDQPDAGVANDAINAVLISYAPGEFVSGTFYIDNLVAVPDTSTPTTPPPTSAPSPPGAILFDEFTTPNPFDTTIWQARLPLSRSAATTGVSIPLANDGYGATLLYPANRPDTEWGPGYSTQIKSTEMNIYGNYEARLKSGRANAGEGVISAFFIYFNDEVDYDGDGIHDNHEIDFELLNSDRSSIWCSVYTDYQNVNDVCTFHRNAARVDIATGEVWATVPGNEGNWDLVQIDSLDWSVPGFDHSSSFYTYGFEWSESRVAFWIDLEDGVGRRQLFEVLSDGSGGPNDHIPNMPASTFFNLWHNHVDWFSRADAPPMSVDTVMEIDYVSVMPISTANVPTSHPTTLPPVPAPTIPPVQTVIKHVCSKNEPLPATICAEGSPAGGSCSTENRPDTCGNGGKVCWWHACAV